MHPPTLLFLCTGNYYRSRFAEAVFNHRAELRGLAWRASSRGIAIDRLGLNAGNLSPHTILGLRERGIQGDNRPPASLTYGDLKSADLVVALDEREHRPMLDRSFPGWSSRIVFWHVADVGDLPADQALTRIEASVAGLVDQLASG
jgi:protein-tyrosine phosphatase